MDGYEILGFEDAVRGMYKGMYPDYELEDLLGYPKGSDLFKGRVRKYQVGGVSRRNEFLKAK